MREVVLKYAVVTRVKPSLRTSVVEAPDAEIARPGLHLRKK